MRAPTAPRGFTLIEGMVALAVFSVGILGVMQMSILASAQNGLARNQTVATNIARDVVDGLDRLPYAHPYLTASPIASNSPDFTDLTKTSGLHSFADPVPDGQRPYLGAAPQIEQADGTIAPGALRYTVAWRVAPLLDPDGTEAGKRIAVMVSFRVNNQGGPPVPGASTKQLTFWHVKYNPAKPYGPGASGVEEL